MKEGKKEGKKILSVSVQLISPKFWTHFTPSHSLYIRNNFKIYLHTFAIHCVWFSHIYNCRMMQRDERYLFSLHRHYHFQYTTYLRNVRTHYYFCISRCVWTALKEFSGNSRPDWTLFNCNFNHLNLTPLECVMKLLINQLISHLMDWPICYKRTGE